MAARTGVENEISSAAFFSTSFMLIRTFELAAAYLAQFFNSGGWMPKSAKLERSVPSVVMNLS